ncbi:protein of unknown function [Taphrina deformans PYCC 5710]|uniref:DSBA-like thioredoxin domain-containing protein n=1 Tax=Taphrina deformans (strain PYCC 5710 / ATCC 11124 / CBS 356.35 / IMI 108563 / JCM 9778 / NBRC 8474) TaxID=1097556 RepID=R4XDS3_TAPDE|nr:protein of unknown function [Taphrina deformans PYCC 5710]|eukprot:CCG83777.1 protein of unknown function [Taphrina deformans PYCC 5710]
MFEANATPPGSDINVYFDIVSPQSYLAFTGYAVHYVPVHEAGIVRGSQQHKDRDATIVLGEGTEHGRTDLRRWAKLLGVTLRPPSPTGCPSPDSLLCARVLAVIAHYHSSKLAAAMAALWTHTFSRDGDDDDRRDLASPTDLGTILSRVFTGAEIDMMLKLARSDEIRDVVRRNTEKVVRDGGSRCPWIEVVKQSGETAHFAGTDRWIHVVDFAGLSWDGYGIVGGRERSVI